MQHLYKHNLGSEISWSAQKTHNLFACFDRQTRCRGELRFQSSPKSGRTLTNQLLQDDSQTQVIDSVVREHV